MDALCILTVAASFPLWSSQKSKDDVDRCRTNYRDLSLTFKRSWVWLALGRCPAWSIAGIQKPDLRSSMTVRLEISRRDASIHCWIYKLWRFLTTFETFAIYPYGIQNIGTAVSSPCYCMLHQSKYIFNTASGSKVHAPQARPSSLFQWKRLRFKTTLDPVSQSVADSSSFFLPSFGIELFWCVLNTGFRRWWVLMKETTLVQWAQSTSWNM